MIEKYLIMIYTDLEIKWHSDCKRFYKKDINMKKIAYVIFFLSIAWNVNAQSKQGKNQMHKKNPTDRAAKVVTKLDSLLSLTPEQETKISSLVQTKLVQVKEIRAKYSDANGKIKEDKKEAFRKEVKPIRQNFQTELGAILTPEQQAKFAALKAKKKEEHKNKDIEAADELLED